MRKYEDHELGPEQSKVIVCRIGHANSGAKLHKGTIYYREVIDPKPWDVDYVITSAYAYCSWEQRTRRFGCGAMAVHPIHRDWRTREFDDSELTCKHCMAGLDARRDATA